MQAGGHRFDPGQLHHLSFGCFLIAAAAVAAIRKQAGRQISDLAGFLTASGRGRAAKLPRGMMFDNEIDWVNVFGSFCIRREASNEAHDSNAFEYKAEHKM